MIRRGMDIIRVCSYNVRRFTGHDGRYSVRSIATALKSLDIMPSILCLNEVDLNTYPNALEELVSSLKSDNHEYNYNFFGHVKEKFGNAILTSKRFKVLDVRNVKLRGGTKITFPKGTRRFDGEITSIKKEHRIVRGLLEVDICLVEEPEHVISIYCTHLDHISEDERKVQLEHIRERVKSGIILGDLNALKREDYSDEEWAALEARHEQRSWSGPHSGCLDILHSNGWIDCYEYYYALNDQAMKYVSPGQKCTAHDMYRIDYCFMHKSLLSNLQVVNAFIYKNCNHSDHFPLLIDLSRRAMHPKL